MDVTARELKNRLGTYLAAVQRGEVVRVTRRGHPVAELRPPALSARDVLDRLVAEGRATRGTGRFEPYDPRRARYSGTDIILEDRYSEQP